MGTDGKDRTDVAMAVLLTTLGVPRETVIKGHAVMEKLVPEPAAVASGARPARPGLQRFCSAVAELTHRHTSQTYSSGSCRSTQSFGRWYLYRSLG